MDDLTLDILSILTVAITIGAIVLLFLSSRTATGTKGRNSDLCLLLGIAWIVGGLATEVWPVAGLGFISMIAGYIFRKMQASD